MTKIVEAFAEWDDPHAFRVFLAREDADGFPDMDSATPMESVLDTETETVEGRLYRAVILACARDIAHQQYERVLGWPTEAPAKRAAKAVNAELARIAKGEPGPSTVAIQFALAAVSKRRRR